MKVNVTTQSENFAERELHTWDYHPDLCFKFGQGHKAYGWSPIPRGEWNEEQTAAYLRAWAKEPAA